MKVYVDIIFLINYTYDFLILNMVKLILRRNVSFKRILLSSFIGSISSFSIFYQKLDNAFITILISVFMCIICFGYKDIIYLKNNLMYFYMISIIFGGMIYLLNIKFNNVFDFYDNYSNKTIINFIGLVIGGIITYFYYLYLNKNNNYYHKNYYRLNFSFEDKYYTLDAFYDTGNLIKDPYKGRSIILVNEDVLYGDIKNKSPIYVPVSSINGSFLIKCYKPNVLIINNKVINNCLLGLFKGNYFKDNINAIISGYIGDKIR